jgi:hypothetical protein
MNKLTEKQRVSFQRGLEGRAKKMDRCGSLEKYHVEYFYHPDFNFGKLFRTGTDKALMEAFMEAYSNDAGKVTLLVFSRQRDNIYVAVADPPCCPFPGLWFDDDNAGALMISTLEDFLEEV